NPLPMLVVDSETLQFLNVNRAARTLYGYTVKEFKQMTALDIRPKTVEKDFLSILNYLHSRRKLTHNGIWQHLTRKKKIIDVEIFSHSLEYEGKLATLFLVNDVTQRVLMQRKLSESQAHLQSILDATYQAYLLIGVNHKVLKFNRVADQMVQRYFHEKIKEGDSILDYVGEENKEDFKKHFLRAFNGEKVLIQRPLNINEYQAYVDVQYLPAYNKYGKIFAVAFVLTDITERKKAEEERQELLKNLANFAFITSHNLRRPLANVLGLVSLFDTEDDDFNRMLIEKLKFSARELDKIIYDMNDLLKHKELKGFMPPLSRRGSPDNIP
ncbi:MAG: PAS domain S-box protein, partial [Bacteroidota bacterium]